MKLVFNTTWSRIVIVALALAGVVLASGCAVRRPLPQDKSTRLLPVRRLPATLTNIDFPTALAFDTDGTLYFTEKGGALRVVRQGRLLSKPLVKIDVPRLTGYHETGLLGLALSPRFQKDRTLYLYHTFRQGNGLANRVIAIDVRRPRAKSRLVLGGLIGERIHDGGKLAFGPDGKLYVSVGEANRRELAQDRSSVNGKILRIEPDGSVPDDNPFDGSPVFALGLRNVFGLAFDDRGRLYATENGPTEDDEVNLIRPGQNYGWPRVTGSKNSRFEPPLIVYHTPIAPTGIIFYRGSRLPPLRNHLVFGDWNNGQLHRLTIKNGRATDEIVLSLGEGVTALAEAPDGAIYAATRSQIVRIDRL